MKVFMRHSRAQARQLENSLKEMKSDYKIALLHYSPTAQTLFGEKKEIFPFLGCYYLAKPLIMGKRTSSFMVMLMLELKKVKLQEAHQ